MDSMYAQGLITDEVGVSVYWEDQTTIDCRSAAGSSASYRGAHPRLRRASSSPGNVGIFSSAAY